MMDHVAVAIDGKDVSTNLRPYLLTADVTDLAGTASDTATLTFDDADGQIKLPRDGAAIVVSFHGGQVFEGVVDGVTSTGSRGGGRVLRVGAKGFDTRGKVKELQHWHADDATLQEVLNKAARYGDIDSVVVDPAFASIKRDYWSPDGASFIAWGERLAREMGATFKIRGRVAVFAKRGTGQTASGSGAMPTIIAKVPGNVINWDVSPIVGRPRFSRAKVQYFDRDTASFKMEELDFAADDGRPAATYEQRSMAVDAEQAKAGAEAMKTETERRSGQGRITMEFDANAQAEASLILTGARPGIDGTYRITSVQHKADRKGGTTTTVVVEQPQGGAGKDDRQAG